MQNQIVENLDTESLPDKPKARAKDRLESLHMVRTGFAPKVLGVLLLLMFSVTVVCALYVPWRQSVAGSGEIIVFSPMERPQTIEAQIQARLLKWHVRDGQLVQAGELLADLTEVDPRFLDKSQQESLSEQKKSLAEKRDAARDRAKSLAAQLDETRNSRTAAVSSAQQRIAQAQDRLFAAQQSIDAAEQGVKTTQWQLDRVNVMFEKGLKSQRDQQLAMLENVKAKAELQRAKAAYDVVKRDNDIAGLDFKRVSADTEASVNAIQASLADAHQVIASTSADISKLEIDVQNLAQRVQQRTVRSPCAGRVVRLNRVGSGETVNAGSVLATIVPGTEDRAAAIMIRDYDVPLVAVGDPVRLSISGWPSLQFVGWPSVAVGTFAGRISVVDAVDDGTHHYRAIVVPDFKAIAEKKEEPWPSTKFLRPGAQVTGWVLLSDVPLWYELWRQFNGFQPTLNGTAAGNPTAGSDSKQK